MSGGRRTYARAIRPNDKPRSGRQEHKKPGAAAASAVRRRRRQEGATCKARQAVCDVLRLAAPFPGAVASGGAVAHSGRTPPLSSPRGLTALLAVVLWNAAATPC